MPAIVTGNKRTVEGKPGKLSDDALERAKQAIKKVQDSKPEDCPPGYDDLRWSTTQSRWICSSKDGMNMQVWDENQWLPIKEFLRGESGPVIRHPYKLIISFVVDGKSTGAPERRIERTPTFFGRVSRVLSDWWPK